MALPSYEKLGVFYLGREIEREGSAPGPDLLYDSRDLTMHAVCIGMTGSGKTGLCVSLLEEAALDGIPAVVIDPKGDLGNLLLTFPDLAPADFKPWVDPGEAARKGQSVDVYAAETATRWREGLAQWGEDGARIQRLREAAEFTIYTPGSTSGRPLSVLRSFAAPPAAGDAAALKERIGSAVSGLLALLGIDADPIKSREHILLAAILDAAWRNGQSPDLAALIQAVQKPPFDKVGVFDLESFYPSKERMELALRINGLLAAPGFDAWLQGDALDAQALLYSADGAKPRVSIISIAHLNDAERMFVVTLVANELVAWMRRQPGTTSLRALFYMDEVFGYFPPTAMPASKTPLLTLMKQARAFGLGVVLATQNPVDLDYKGLGNAGTWFIGRLQTERDQLRVIDGLLATDSAAGSDRAALTAQMSKLAQRRFLMRNVHDDAPVLFESRWALSYLRGPLTLAEIQQLTPRSGARSAPAPESSAPPDTASPVAGAAAATKPNVQSGVTERYVAAQSGDTTYRPCIGANVRAHFVDAKTGVDAWQSWYYLASLTADGVDWAAADVLREAPAFGGPQPGARYAATPATALSPKPYASWADKLADYVYRNATLDSLRSTDLKQVAAPGCTEGEFRTQLTQVLRERRDAAVAELRSKYARRLDALGERVRRADQRVEREQSQATSQTTASAISIAGSVLGALLGGRRSSAIGKAGTAVRSYGRIEKERADVAQARADAEATHQQVAALNAELEGEIERVSAGLDPQKLPIDKVSVKPRKSDIAVEDVALVWRA
jgi:Helicase HerA, central domain